MFTIAAQIVLHSVVKAMDWRNNVYVPVRKLLSILFAIAIVTNSDLQYCLLIRKNSNLEISFYTGWFFSLVPHNFSTKKKTANQPIRAAVLVNPFTKKVRDWLLGGSSFWY